MPPVPDADRVLPATDLRAKDPHTTRAWNGCRAARVISPRMTTRVAGADCSGLVRYVPFREPAPSRTVGFVFHERCARVEDAIELAGFLRELQQLPRNVGAA